MNILLGLLVLAGAVVMFILAANPAKMLDWKKSISGVDERRVISDMNQWKGMQSMCFAIIGLTFLFLSIYVFALPAIHRRRQEKAQASNEAMNAAMQRVEAQSRIQRKISELEWKRDLPGTWPSHRERYNKEIAELRSQLEKLKNEQRNP